MSQLFYDDVQPGGWVAERDVVALRPGRALGRLVGVLGRELAVIRPYLEILKVRMEERLQTALFLRTPRGVLLTDEGRRYFEQVSAALAQIAAATYELESRAQERWLRLIVVPGFAGRWLRHHLAE